MTRPSLGSLCQWEEIRFLLHHLFREFSQNDSVIWNSFNDGVDLVNRTYFGKSVKAGRLKGGCMVVDAKSRYDCDRSGSDHDEY